MEKQIVILGAGAAGLGANYSLKQKGYNPIVLERMKLMVDYVVTL